MTRSPVGVFRHQLFVPSETFIRTQSAALVRNEPVFVARRPLAHRPERVRAITMADSTGRLGDLAYGVSARSGVLTRLFRSEGLTLVHAHFGPDGLYAADAADRAGIPLVVTLHGRDVTVSPGALLRTGRPVATRYALQRASLGQRASRLLCVSDQIRDAALRAGLPAARLVTHYIGVNTTLFTEGAWPRPQRIIHVARLVEKKGTRYLLAAFAAIAGRHPEATLEIIGDGPLRASLIEQATSLGIGDRVAFVGVVSEQEVRERVGGSRIFALPSVTAADGDREGLPIALIEAMSLGAAIVATRHSGIPEAINSDSLGILVAERDTGGLADALDHLLENEATAEALGRAGAAHVREHFDLDRQTRELEDLYDQARS